jgi:hypothetical protein
MDTVLSHIVTKRLSAEKENIATEVLAFILDSNPSAKKGIMKLLKAIAPTMPDLIFKTQMQANIILPDVSDLNSKTQMKEGSIQPDMWGYQGDKPRVYIENKFWAGLTENQPIAYLKHLTKYTQPSILLVVVPEVREQTVWQELNRRLIKEGVSTIKTETPPGLVHTAETSIGPILAITSWTKLLAFLELELADEPSARSDLLQLKALCDAEDTDAFTPLSTEEISDQRTPKLLLQLSAALEGAVKLGTTKEILDTKGLMPQSSSERIGRYIKFNSTPNFVVWVGINFVLWKKYGHTPLWIVFYPNEFKKSQAAKLLLEEWSAKNGNFRHNNEIVIPFDLPTGEDKDEVIRSILDQFKNIIAVYNQSTINTELDEQSEPNMLPEIDAPPEL